MTVKISESLKVNGYDPDYLIVTLRETLRHERDLFDTKKGYLTTKELHEYELRLTNMESLLVTLMIENIT